MENASKALIIAGAILLSILIIGLGMFVYNQAAGVLKKANVNQQEVQAYNSEFEAYEGTQSGTNVRALCDKVRAHNNANTDDTTMQIKVVLGTSQVTTNTADDKGFTTENINEVKKDIKAGKTYTVDFGYDKSSGYIIAIGIVDKNNNKQ